MVSLARILLPAAAWMLTSSICRSIKSFIVAHKSLPAFSHLLLQGGQQTCHDLHNVGRLGVSAVTSIGGENTSWLALDIYYGRLHSGWKAYQVPQIGNSRVYFLHLLINDYNSIPKQVVFSQLHKEADLRQTWSIPANIRESLCTY